MRALLTGGTGYLGRVVLTRLLDKGVEVRALVRHTDTPLPKGVERIVADLGDPSCKAALSSAMIDTDVVVHCAAHLGSGDREFSRRVNVAGTRLLLESAVRTRVRRFVHVSSIAVHGSKRPNAMVSPDEDYELCADLREHYAWSKIAAERWARLYARQGLLDVAILRPGIIFGEGRDFVAPLCRGVAGALHVVGGRAKTRVSLVHVQDVVDAIWLAITRPGRFTRPIIVVGPETPTQGEYLARRAAILGERLIPLYLPLAWMRPWARWRARRASERAGCPPSFLYSLVWTDQEPQYDLAGAAEDLDWRPRMSVDNTLRELVSGRDPR